MVDSNNSFLPTSIYQANKKGIKVARPDIILPPANAADSFFTINRSIAQINSQEVLFLSRHDLVDSPLVSKPRFLKDTGVSLSITAPLARNLWTLFNNNVNSINLSLSVPETVDFITADTVNGGINISMINALDNYSVQLQFVDPTEVV